MRRTVWAWARVLGGVGILGLLLWRLGSSAFLDGLRVIDGTTLLAAAGIGLLTTVFSAWRWCLVARGLGIRLPLRAAVADYYRALFLNAALPGGILGDVHRAVRHGRDVGDVGRGVRSVVLERTAGQIVVVTLGVTTLLILPSPLLAHSGTLFSAPDGAGVAGISVAGLAVAGGLAVAAGLAIWVVGRIRARGRTTRWGRALRTTAAEARLGLLARASWPGIVVSSALVLAGHLATFLVAARAAGSSAPVVELAPLMLLALLAMMLPLNVGGWGPREGVLAWAFGAAGLSASLGLTVAVVYGVLAFVASLPGAGVLLVRWAARLKANRLAADRLRLDQPTAEVPLVVANVPLAVAEVPLVVPAFDHVRPSAIERILRIPADLGSRPDAERVLVVSQAASNRSESA